MARIRTIKPGFWTDEDLSELPEATHLLAAQLLNYADDAGYFNANPKLIKAEVSPLREPSVSIPDSLNLLWKMGWLELGLSNDGKRYGRICTFADHQVINRPTPSKIKNIQISFEDYTTPHGIISEPSCQEGKGREGLEEGEMVAPHEASPMAPSVGCETSEPEDLETVPLAWDLSDEAKATRMWNDLALELGLSTVQRLTKTRKVKLRARLSDCDSLPGFAVVLEKVRGSPFLRGDNKQGWRANFDFLLQESSFTKILEGAYDGKPSGSNGSGVTDVARDLIASLPHESTV